MSSSNYSVGFLLAALVCFSMTTAHAQTEEQMPLFEKILSQGVPKHGLTKIFEYLNREGENFQQDVYTCTNLDENNLKPCEETKRVSKMKTVTIKPREHAVVIDFTKGSLDKRFFLINLKTGEVKKILTTHGKGSGNALYAYKFSNIKDSHQTSLGMYIVGETYTGGKYGETLRMYGLEKSNDNAYNRDIVMHGAWYAREDFKNEKNVNNGNKPYNRLGVSQGCPAVSPENIKMLIPLLKNGALVYLDHAGLADKAIEANGKEVVGPNPNK